MAGFAGQRLCAHHGGDRVEAFYGLAGCDTIIGRDEGQGDVICDLEWARLSVALLGGRPPPDAPMSATFAKLFSSVYPRASDFTGHFSAGMLVKTTNRSAR